MRKQYFQIFQLIFIICFICSMADAGSIPGIFSFDTSQQAQSAWTASSGMPVDIGIDPNLGKYLQFTARNASGSCNRNYSADFSGADVISMMVHLSDHGMTGVVGFHFKSGTGYYSAFLEVFGHQRKAGGWQRVMFPKKLLQAAGAVSGWNAISQIGISVYPDTDFVSSDITVKLTDFHADAFSEVGNLVQNSSFEYSVNSNMPYSWNPSGHWSIARLPWFTNMPELRNVWARVSSDAYQGQYCMRLENKSGFPNMLLEGVWLSVNDPNASHTFSAYMKSGSGVVSVKMTFGNYSKTILVGPSWARFSVSGVPQTTKISPYIELMTNPGVIYIDAVQLEYGPKTAYKSFDSDFGLSEMVKTLRTPIQYTPRSESYMPPIQIRQKLISTSVNIDTDGRFCVNGNPFIPYAYGSESIPDQTIIEEVAQSGFNSVCVFLTSSSTISQIQSLLDLCAEKGLYVIPWIYSLVNDDTMAVWIQTWKNHPAVIAWYILDEPGNPSDPLIQARIDRARIEDPNHPIYVNYVKYNYNGGNLPGDIASIDDYVIPWSCPYRNQAASKIMVNAVSSAKKPSWVWLQGSGYAYWLEREPTPLEISSMVYMNVINGVRGFKYFIGKPFTEPLWNEMKNLGIEIESLTEILYSTQTTPVIIADNNDVLFCVKRFNDKTYIIAANSKNKVSKITFEGGSIKGRFVKLLFENRTVPISNNSFTEYFEPYSRHIYVLTDENIAAYWEFDTGLTESVQQNNFLADSGNPVISYQSKVGTGSILFDGIDDRLRTIREITVDSVFSILFWIRPSQIVSGIPFICSGTVPPLFRLEQSGDGRNIAFILSPDGLIESRFETGAVLNQNIWTHCAVVFDGSGYNIYINGNKAVSKSVQLVQPNPLSHNYVLAGGYGNKFFQGEIDDLRIYKDVLSNNEIRSVIQQELSIKHKWEFEAETGSNILFDSVSENTVLLVDSNAQFTWGSEVPILDHSFGKILQITSNSNITIPQVLLNSSFSISFWINPNNSDSQGIFLYQTGVKFFRISKIASSGNCYLKTDVSCDGINWLGIESSKLLQTNTWTHFVCSFDGQKIEIIQNGVVTGSFIISPCNLGNQSGDFCIGRSNSSYFTGSLDDVIISDRVLSSHEVSRLLGLAVSTSCEEMFLIGGGMQADLNRDCQINFKDFSIFAEYWLTCFDSICY